MASILLGTGAAEGIGGTLTLAPNGLDALAAVAAGAG